MWSFSPMYGRSETAGRQRWASLILLFASNAQLFLYVDQLSADETVSRQPLSIDETVYADVIVAGGSTAALAAAFAAADSGARTVLIEPTDWIGGQLTASGVPAVDEAWHKIKNAAGETLLDVARIARDPQNMTPFFRDMLAEIGNPGRGWVSRFCFEPLVMLREHLEPRERQLAARLTVLRDTVVKQVETQGREIKAIVAIQRFPNDLPSRGYDRLPSTDLADWYSADDSRRFRKRVLRIAGEPQAVFIDATEWAEVLVLAGASYLQGIDTADGSLESNDRCGQSTVFGFVQRMHAEPTTDPAPQVDVPNLGWGMYEGREDAWPQVWTYRRIKGSRAEPSYGDLSLQNWGYSPKTKTGGNDYPFGYLFLPRAAAEASRDDWQGGVDRQVMAAAEQRAFGWHQWFRSQTPKSIGTEPVGAERITLAQDVLGTGHGLCKLPYIRDTRRSIGLENFVLRLDDLVGEPGDGNGRGSSMTGTPFPDAIALGAYPADVHLLDGCRYPAHIAEHRDTRPFTIPFRALTNRDFDNMLVAGKSMAQSFMANSATRLHPIEWSTGTAAGVAAAWMAEAGLKSSQVSEQIQPLRQRISRSSPVNWTFPADGG